jgi:guanosine-3',5'-bis(diphosphate) 3'-pyrophosphohydrolase
VEKELSKLCLAAGKYIKGEHFEAYLKDHGLSNVEELYVAMGYGKLEVRILVEKLSPENLAKEAAKTEDSTFMEKVMRAATSKNRKTNSLITVDGMDDVLVHYAKCCHPIPGDSIVGFISRGRGIAIHRSDCRKAFEFDQLRKVDVTWNSKQAGDGQERVVRLKVISQDVPGLLKLMSEAFAQQGINIQSAQIRTTKDKKALCHFEVSVKDTSQLNQAIYEIQKIKGIIGVSRVIH